MVRRAAVRAKSAGELRSNDAPPPPQAQPSDPFVFRVLASAYRLMCGRRGAMAQCEKAVVRELKIAMHAKRHDHRLAVNMVLEQRRRFIVEMSGFAGEAFRPSQAVGWLRNWLARACRRSSSAGTPQRIQMSGWRSTAS